jgi:hypothetical protein
MVEEEKLRRRREHGYCTDVSAKQVLGAARKERRREDGREEKRGGRWK